MTSWLSDGGRANPQPVWISLTVLAFATLSLTLPSPVPTSVGGSPTAGARPLLCAGNGCQWWPCTLVRSSPPASATVSDTAVQPGTPVVFNGSEAGIYGVNYSYDWNFGDGSVGTGQELTHTYDRPGMYLAQLWADGGTCNGGGTANASVWVRAPPGGLNVTARASLQSSMDWPVNVTFVATGAGGSGNLSYSWSFGDGARAGGPDVQHEFNSPGVYLVNSTVTDSHGSAAHYYLTVDIGSVPYTGAAPLSVSLAVAPAGWFPPYQYNWSTDDGTPPLYSQNVTHTFVEPGTYDVAVLLQDRFGDRQILDTEVRVDPVLALRTSFSASKISGPAPLQVALISNVTGGVGPYSYSWAFGDGQGGYGANVSHTYSRPGIYQVTLVVVDSIGDRSTHHLNLTVASPPAYRLGWSQGVVWAVVGVAAVASVLTLAAIRRRVRARGSGAKPDQDETLQTDPPALGRP